MISYGETSQETGNRTGNI